MALLIIGEPCLLFSGLVGERAIGPNLSVRMRIAASHHLAAVFKDLHMIDLRNCPEFEILSCPDVNHRTNGRYIHVRQSQIVARREANDPTDSCFRLCMEEVCGVAMNFDLRHIQPHRPEIIVKDECGVVTRIANSTCTLVSRAQIAQRIVAERALFRLPLSLSLPWALHAMWRDQHPVTCQRIQTAMWGFLESVKVNHEIWLVISRAPSAAVQT